MYRIPIYRPRPDFIINISEIPRFIKNALDELDDFTLNDVIKDGISRFFLNINERYFLLNVKKLFRWRLEPQKLGIEDKIGKSFDFTESDQEKSQQE
jgi:hypothetical protein